VDVLERVQHSQHLVHAIEWAEDAKSDEDDVIPILLPGLSNLTRLRFGGLDWMAKVSEMGLLLLKDEIEQTSKQSFH
jgi:hypothetical protein